jgi:para-aminobenzoate synthetase
MTGPVPDPVAAFRAAAARSDRFFWLDGGGGAAWSGHRSIIGVLDDDDVSLTFDAAAREVRRHRGNRSEVVGDDVFTVLEDEVARDDGDPGVHWVGYLGYACRTDLRARPSAHAQVPDAVWMRCADVRVFDHEPRPAPERTGGPDAGSAVPAAYRNAFERVQEHLHAGDSYEVNLTHRQVLGSPTDPVAAYLRLREANPAPYAGFLRHRGVSLLSSSPERYAAVDRHRWLETRPIKGTTPRGGTPEEDAVLAERLSHDHRYRAENLMIVDLLRNDLALVCVPGTVAVPRLMEVETYATVHQLVSTVRGHLRDDVGTVAALRALFPAGSMTGAPKRRTMEIIDAVEATSRGVYAGTFGWVCADGRADLGVVIRSLVATAAETGWRYELGTGGGITVHSDAASEWAETEWKAARLRAVLDRD